LKEEIRETKGRGRYLNTCWAESKSSIFLAPREMGNRNQKWNKWGWRARGYTGLWGCVVTRILGVVILRVG
jgi:hypothetical protein